MRKLAALFIYLLLPCGLLKAAAPAPPQPALAWPLDTYGPGSTFPLNVSTAFPQGFRMGNSWYKKNWPITPIGLFGFPRFDTSTLELQAHKGIDISGTIGREVYAAAAGKVHFFIIPGYGTTIIIDHTAISSA